MMMLSPSFQSAYDAFNELVAQTGVLSMGKAVASETLLALYDALITANQTMNLTRITDWEGFLIRHILESWLFSLHIPQNAKVIDIGSGAGFPALPLVLFRPDITVVAVESVQKKGAFIQTTAEALGVGNRLTVLTQRCEDLGQQKAYREQFDCVTARAVANLATLGEYTLPFAKVETGCVLAMKGPSWPEEYLAAEEGLETLGGLMTDCFDWEAIPALAHCYLLRLTKTERTPKKYPRQAGTPLRLPLRG
jgi:16S rRNA (guanine527-N7)-methyltransferase